MQINGPVYCETNELRKPSLYYDPKRDAVEVGLEFAGERYGISVGPIGTTADDKAQFVGSLNRTLQHFDVSAVDISGDPASAADRTKFRAAMKEATTRATMMM